MIKVYRKAKIYKLFIIILILFLGLYITLAKFIEFRNLEYYVFNEKGEELNAIVITKNDYIRVKFTGLNDNYFITIIPGKKIVGINENEPLNLDQYIYMFNNNSKKIGYTDGVFYLDINKDTIKFNSFKHNKMNLKTLGEEILIVRKN